jgi:hypothetical protein
MGFVKIVARREGVFARFGNSENLFFAFASEEVGSILHTPRKRERETSSWLETKKSNPSTRV